MIKDTSQVVYLNRLDRGATHVNASEDHDWEMDRAGQGHLTKVHLELVL